MKDKGRVWNTGGVVSKILKERSLDAETLRSGASFDEWDRKEGTPGPMGVTWIPSLNAWNFALYSRRATGATLLLYSADDPVTPVLTVRLDVRANKSGRIWHCWVHAEQVPNAAYYAWRVEGRHDPAAGYRFDARKILLDPFAPAVFFPPDYDRMAACYPGTERWARAARRASEIGPAPAPDRNGGKARASHDLIVYELHVKGFTLRANSGVTPDRRGTFAGLVEKIPYLKSLGITAVELMPIHQCDPQEGSYWGYMTLNFFSPHKGYAANKAEGGAIEEFRAMVEAFHANGIDVWLDVVYNHTSEAGPDGPVYSYRGIDNQSYYLLNGGRKLPQRHRVRQHVSLRSSRGSDADYFQSPLLDQGDECGRLPLRPGLGVHDRGRMGPGP